MRTCCSTTSQLWRAWRRPCRPRRPLQTACSGEHSPSCARPSPGEACSGHSTAPLLQLTAGFIPAWRLRGVQLLQKPSWWCPCHRVLGLSHRGQNARGWLGALSAPLAWGGPDLLPSAAKLGGASAFRAASPQILGRLAGECLHCLPFVCWSCYSCCQSQCLQFAVVLGTLALLWCAVQCTLVTCPLCLMHCVLQAEWWCRASGMTLPLLRCAARVGRASASVLPCRCASLEDRATVRCTLASLWPGLQSGVNVQQGSKCPGCAAEARLAYFPAWCPVCRRRSLVSARRLHGWAQHKACWLSWGPCCGLGWPATWQAWLWARTMRGSCAAS